MIKKLISRFWLAAMLILTSTVIGISQSERNAAPASIDAPQVDQSANTKSSATMHRKGEVRPSASGSAARVTNVPVTPELVETPVQGTIVLPEQFESLLNAKIESIELLAQKALATNQTDINRINAELIKSGNIKLLTDAEIVAVKNSEFLIESNFETVPSLDPNAEQSPIPRGLSKEEYAKLPNRFIGNIINADGQVVSYDLSKEEYLNSSFYNPNEE